MRQVGLFAAAAEYALDNNLERLAEDHANAKLLGRALAQSSRIGIEVGAIHTNVLVFEHAPARPSEYALQLAQPTQLMQART